MKAMIYQAAEEQGWPGDPGSLVQLLLGFGVKVLEHRPSDVPVHLYLDQCLEQLTISFGQRQVPGGPGPENEEPGPENEEPGPENESLGPDPNTGPQLVPILRLSPGSPPSERARGPAQGPPGGRGRTSPRPSGRTALARGPRGPG